MSFRSIDPKPRLKGMVLAMVKLLFPEGAPTLEAYCAQTGVAPSTFQRTARWALGLLPGLLRTRRPGPRPLAPTCLCVARRHGRDGREAALKVLEDLRAWLQTKRTTTDKNACYSPEAKERIVRVATELQASGAMGYAEIAGVLGINERQLRRLRRDVEGAEGTAPRARSRRPERTAELHPAVQRLIRQIAISSSHYTATDVKRILEKNYREKLVRHHGAPTLSRTTVARYLRQGEDRKARREHPRGTYDYPEPFQQAAIDTTYFKLFRWTFYLVTVFEVGGRLHLLTRVFVRENTAAVVEVIEECLLRYPGLEAFVIDRGRPYLNEEVKRLLEERGKLRIVCPPATPTAKAAAERHFGALKPVVRRALELVFPADPGWPRHQVAKLVEVAVAVFQDLYNRLPQAAFEGKSPAERAAVVDPLRAAEKMMRLLERSLESEPADELARRLHRRFQLPNAEAETVKRRLEDEVAGQLGPPIPEDSRDPLGFLEARARRLWEGYQRWRCERRYLDEVDRRRQAEEQAHREQLHREAREREERPERFLDATLRSLAQAIETGIPGLVRIFTRQLAALLQCLAERLGHAFQLEASRLRNEAPAVVARPLARQQLQAVLEDVFQKLRQQGAVC